MSLLSPQLETLRRIEPREVVGTVDSVRGLTLTVRSLPLPVGALVRLEGRNTAETAASGGAARGEVIGFNGGRTLVMLLDGRAGIAPGWRAIGEQAAQTVQVGGSLLGRVIDGFGMPLDGGSIPVETVARPLSPPRLNPLSRRVIERPLPTGIRAIDALLTMGRGQRLGVFAGPGVGKSSLLSAIARRSSADVNVIALIGERGREVKEFIEHALGEEGLRRSVVIASTSDESPLLRVRAAMVACAVAEHFRDLGRDVMLMMDSVTRFAQAQRQIGLAAGEQPATKGYTPSVFAIMPQILERAGAVEGGGSISGLYTILVEGDDLSEPISDAARGILDGHVVLSRRLATRGHYPAIDVLDSISRVADAVTDENHQTARRRFLSMAAAYREAEEIISIGAYVAGSDPDVDLAIEMRPRMQAFLCQGRDEVAEYPRVCRTLLEIAAESEQVRQRMAASRRSGGGASGAGAAAGSAGGRRA